MVMKIKWIASRCLLAFVLISIGYALGRESGLRSARASAGNHPSTATAPDDQAPPRVVVTYFHATFRCVTCNTIERLARETVNTRFADDLEAGRIEWRIVNYQEDEALAKQYGIAAACVVVASDRGDETLSFDRLDGVWEFVDDPPAFSSYVGEAIQKHLSEEKKP